MHWTSAFKSKDSLSKTVPISNQPGKCTTKEKEETVTNHIDWLNWVNVYLKRIWTINSINAITIKAFRGDYWRRLHQIGCSPSHDQWPYIACGTLWLLRFEMSFRDSKVVHFERKFPRDVLRHPRWEQIVSHRPARKPKENQKPDTLLKIAKKIMFQSHDICKWALWVPQYCLSCNSKNEWIVDEVRVCATINWVWAGAKQSRARRREREGSESSRCSTKNPFISGNLIESESEKGKFQMFNKIPFYIRKLDRKWKWTRKVPDVQQNTILYQETW